MNKLSFICFVLIFSTNIFAQQAINNAVQISTEFDSESGRVSFIADNQDFCDYVVFVKLEGSSPRFETASSGKRELFSIKPTLGMSYSGYNFAMYRGNIDTKPNIDFAYRLPIKQGDSLLMKVNENTDGYQMDFTFYSDTIYASRGGIVCNDKLKDYTAKGHQKFGDNRIFRQITIYHNDGTFGEYVFGGKQLVYAGYKIKMGQPIAVLRKDNINKANFAVYFLDKNKIEDISIGNKHTHFRPFFQTANEEKVRLEEDKIYICEFNDEMFMQDMNKSQQKKFLKNKQKNENNKK